jgi:hypothetical protein
MVVGDVGFGLLVEFMAAWAGACPHLRQHPVVLARQDCCSEISSTIFA